jgi:hypothetical protein
MGDGAAGAAARWRRLTGGRALATLTLPAQLETLSDLAPYVAILVAGFAIGAWGQAAKVPLAVALGILLIVLAVVLFQLRANDFPELPSGL